MRGFPPWPGQVSILGLRRYPILSFKVFMFDYFRCVQYNSSNFYAIGIPVYLCI